MLWLMGKNFFDQPVKKNAKKTYANIRKIATGQRYDYTAACLMDYVYFSDNYKTIVIDLRKPKSIRCWS